MDDPSPPPPEVERRALELAERLANWAGKPRARERLLKGESPQVRDRVAALEASARAAAAMLPTEGPGLAGGAAPPPPLRVGPFRVEDKIGEGGMGAVYRGRRDDGLYDQTVAIKFIHAHLAALAGSAFDAERRILARLEHPHIARLIDGGVADDGRPYLIMEFVDGRPIDEASRGLTAAARTRLFIDAARAVQFAHTRLVAHADLKPGNILVDREGRVKLLDFGIARLLGDGAAAAAQPTPLTRGFASPQRLAGLEPSIADDVFALGETLRQVLEGAGDEDSAAIVLKAEAADEAERYASVAALIEDLERWLDLRPVSAQPPRAGYRLRKFVRRRRGLVGATAAAMAAILAAVVLAAVNGARADRERAEASARFADARSVAHYLLFDLMDRLEAQPRALALRADVARVAQANLDRLSHAEAADPALRLELASGLRRLASEQASVNRPNLHLPDAARVNLRRAADIAGSLDGAAARRLLADIRLDQANLAAAFDNDTVAAEGFLRQGLALQPQGGAADPVTAAQYRLAQARVRGWEGRYADEAAQAALGLGLAGRIAGPEGARLRAAGADMEAEGDYYLGRLSQAEAEYRAQLRELEEARRLAPDDVYTLALLSRARWSLATTLEQEKRFAEATPLLGQARTEGQAVADFDPADAEARRRLRIVDNAYAQNLAFRGRTDEALAILNAHAADDARQWRAHPDEPLRLHDYALSMTMIGEALAGAGRRAESCRADALALDLFGRLRRMGRLTQWDIGQNIQTLDKRRAVTCPGT